MKFSSTCLIAEVEDLVVSGTDSLEFSGSSKSDICPAGDFGLAQVIVFCGWSGGSELNGLVPIFDDIVRNSNSSNKAFSSGSFRGSSSRLFSSKSTGTSILIVARKREKIICSLFSSILVLSAPFSSSVLCSNTSILPNSFSSFTAVFSPTPGQPGILSDASPIKPSKSIT